MQCDHCEKWYHCICVDITAAEADSADTYKCPYCIQKQKGKIVAKKDTTSKGKKNKLTVIPIEDVKEEPMDVVAEAAKIIADLKNVVPRSSTSCIEMKKEEPLIDRPLERQMSDIETTTTEAAEILTSLSCDAVHILPDSRNSLNTSRAPTPSHTHDIEHDVVQDNAVIGTVSDESNPDSIIVDDDDGVADS